MEWPYSIYHCGSYVRPLSPKQLQAVMDKKAKKESEKFRSRR